VTLAPAEKAKDKAKAGGTLDLTLEVGIGQAEVTRGTS
jgi:hypothetical protein